MTVAMVRISPLALRGGPWDAPPGSIQVNGIRVDGAQVGWTDGTYRLVNVILAGDPPSELHTLAGQSYSLNGNDVTVTRTWNPPTLPNAKTFLKSRLNSRATEEWIKCRGTKSTDIETANTNGANAIDAAANLSQALAAYQAVTWP